MSFPCEVLGSHCVGCEDRCLLGYDAGYFGVLYREKCMQCFGGETRRKEIALNTYKWMVFDFKVDLKVKVREGIDCILWFRGGVWYGLLRIP